MSKRPLVIASHNKHKVAEMRRMLEDLPFVVRSLADYPAVPEIEETGETFAENARQKALQAARFTGQLAMADDSGLMVDALEGAPGVRSARYAGATGPGKDAANNALLLRNMASVPRALRTARFVCAIVIAEPGGILWEGEGTVAGLIGTELRGTEESFGYDPLFYPDGYDVSFDDLSPEEKDRISHRGQAVRMAREFLRVLTWDAGSC